jgi:hypothetical protein
MSTPEHHHKNDGGHYPDCPRCRLEQAAPDLLEACKGTIVWFEKLAQLHPDWLTVDIDTDFFEFTGLRAAIAKAEKE